MWSDHNGNHSLVIIYIIIVIWIRHQLEVSPSQYRLSSCDILEII